MVHVQFSVSANSGLGLSYALNLRYDSLGACSVYIQGLRGFKFLIYNDVVAKGSFAIAGENFSPPQLRPLLLLTAVLEY